MNIRLRARMMLFARLDARPDELCKLSICGDREFYMDPSNTYAQELRSYIEFVHSDDAIDPMDFGVIY